MKIPKVGTVCAIRWLDSGVINFRTDAKPQDRNLPYYTTIGKIAHANPDRVVLLTEWENGGTTGFTDQTIATNCIQEIVIYKEA